jgi:hypothetical protein
MPLRGVQCEYWRIVALALALIQWMYALASFESLRTVLIEKNFSACAFTIN